MNPEKFHTIIIPFAIVATIIVVVGKAFGL